MRTLGRARLSVSVIFLVHGLIYATWVSRIPAIQASLRMSAGTLGSVLAAVAVGSILSMPVAGWLIGVYGSRRVVICSSFVFCLTLPLIALSPAAPWLAGALAVFGAAAGAMDVSMNAQGVAVENHYHRPVMSSFHALFSIGGMLGSAIGGVVAARGIAPAVQFWASAAAFVVIAAAVFPLMLPRSEDAAGHASFTLNFPRRLAALGMLAFCVLVGEGAMADWTSVYLRSSLGTGPGTAAAGYAVFSGAMAGGRLVGDRLTAAFGRISIVRRGAIVAAAGLAVALALGTTISALVGFACAGAGFSVIIPIVFGAGGKIEGFPPGAGIAAVTTMGYLGFLSGPPIIGFTAELFSLRAALGIVVLLAGIASLLAASVEPGRTAADTAGNRSARLNLGESEAEP